MKNLMMKPHYSFLLLILVLGLTSSTFKGKDKDYQVYIKQNNQIQMLKRGVFALERSAFSFQFRFSEPMGIYINASYSSESYEAAKAGKDIKEIPGFSGQKHIFDQKNEEQELLVDNQDYSHYYFKDTSDHSFTGVNYYGEKITCERVISKIITNNGQEKAVNDLDKRIYIVIVHMEKNKNGQEEENKRSFFIIEF